MVFMPSFPFGSYKKNQSFSPNSEASYQDKVRIQLIHKEVIGFLNRGEGDS